MGFGFRFIACKHLFYPHRESISKPYRLYVMLCKLPSHRVISVHLLILANQWHIWLYEAVARDIHKAYAGKLLSHIKIVEDKPIRDENNNLVEPLSERELEVLTLLGNGFSNQEIANELFLTVNTIKVHNRNIFGKLGVKNRTQAVAKGRQLGIVDQ